jgi:PAS domain S-box-containing protein
MNSLLQIDKKNRNIFRLNSRFQPIDNFKENELYKNVYKQVFYNIGKEKKQIKEEIISNGFCVLDREIEGYFISLNFFIAPSIDEYILKILVNTKPLKNIEKEGLISLDENGIIIKIQDKSEIPGKTAKEFIGKNFTEFGDQFLNNRQSFIDLISSINEAEKEEFIWWIKNSDGTLNPTELGIVKLEGKLFIWKNQEKERLNYLKNIMLHEERLNLALDATNTVLWDWDIINEKVFWSENSKTFFNTEAFNEDVSFSKLLAFIHPDCVDEVKTAINDSLFNKKELEVEFYTRRNEGSIVWMELKGKVHTNIQKEPIRMIGSIRDVTIKKKTQIKLSESRENYRLLVEHIPVGILIRTPNRIEFINSTALDVFEIKKASEVVDKDLTSLLKDKELVLFNSHFESIIKGIDSQKNEFILGNETEGYNTYHLESKMIIYNGKEAVNHFIYDITKEKSFYNERARAEIAEELNAFLKSEIKEHKKTQRKLLEAESFSRNIIDSSIDFIIAFDKKGNIQEFNQAAQELFGYSFKEVLKKKDVDFIKAKNSFKKLKKELKENKTFQNELTFIKANGDKFLGVFSASVIWDDEMKNSGYMMVGKDVTQLRKSERRIKESEKKYRDLFENSTDLIQSINKDGEILYVNKAWTQTLGYSESEIKTLNIKDIISHHSNYFNVSTYIESLFHESDNPLKVIVYKAKNGEEFILEGNSSINFEKGKAISSRSIFRNITDVRKAQEKIQNQAAKLNSIFNSSSHIFWTIDKRLCLTSFNKNFAEAIYKNYGTYPELNTDYSSSKNHFANEEKHNFWNVKYKDAFEGKMVHFETETKDLEGKKIYREVFLNPVLSASGEINEIAGIAHDITDKKLAEESFMEQSAKINSIFESAANMVIFTLNNNFVISSFNRNLAKLLILNYGVTLEIGCEIDISEIGKFTSNFARINKVIEAAFNGKTQHIEINITNARGQEKWYEIYFNPVYLEYKKINEISCIAFEISQRKETEDRLLSSLKDKEVLLKEVHHRVKNNLQVISSILSLQTSYVRDEKTLNILQESQNRIKSMSFIHESLYQNEDFTSIKISEYIFTLTQNLFYSYRLEGEKVKLETDFDDVFLNIDQAIPCGLIINELVSNALKYAFIDRPNGIIKVEVKQNRNNISLQVGDNGVGLPESIKIGVSDTLGFQLVHALVDQLDANIKINREKGTKYLITFEQNPI